MNTFYIQAIFTASLGGILFGYDMGVISGALPLLSAYFNLTSSQEEWIVSLLYFGGGFGAASGGFICDLFGRKTAILLTDVVFSLGALLLYCAQSVESVMIGRFVVGWAVALSGIADVAYLHEISSVWEEGEEYSESTDRPIEGDGIAQRAIEANVVATASRVEGEEIHNKHDQESGGRGSVVSVNEACISLGFLLAFGVAYVLGGIGNEQQNELDSGGYVEARVVEASNAWRIMFAFGGILAVLQFVGMLFMPESPVWLNEKGRIGDAVAARSRIRGERRADHGLRNGGSSTANTSQREQNQVETNQSIDAELNTFSSTRTSEHSSSSFAIEEIIHTPTRNRCLECFICLRSIPFRIKAQVQDFLPYKKQCAIAFFLAASQQFCGHPSVLGYSAEIFTILDQPQTQDVNTGNDINNENGQDDLTSIELTVGIGALKFLTTCIVILYVEKGGRIRWLLSGMSCILLSLTFLCIAFSGRNNDGIGQSSNNMQQQQNSSSLKNDFGIAGIYGVAIGYAASFGPLTWLITSELFPSSIRGRSLGLATIITYLAAGFVSRTFLSLQESLGLAGCFALYWTSTMISIVLVWMGVPDTGEDKTPEQIDRELNDLWKNHSRCPLFLRRRSRRSAEGSSWASLGNYGSSINNDACLSPEPSFEETNASESNVSPSLSRLTPRRTSSLTKEIV